jgi:hypothetical protein
MTSQYIAPVHEDTIMKCTESCWVIREQGNREKVIGGYNLIEV